MVDAAFLQADINRDNRLDLNEFRNFAQQNSYNGGNGFTSDSSSHESSSLTGGPFGGAHYEASYRSEADSGLAGGVNGSYNSTSSSYSTDNTGYGAAGYGAAGLVGGGAGYGVSSTESVNSTAVQSYATDSRGLFQDNNPQIIRRPAPSGPLTYTQNIRVRFLQPPPIPPPGPLIIKEVRPPQPPPPPPLHCWNHRIMRWCEGDKEGELVVGGNGLGKQLNQLNFPTGLSFDNEGNLYVADYYNYRIQKYKKT
ncbi:unnamed protein product [Adineta steineri]|uniref:EF-hand domain-containing protein n=1 Tax=Adineta steineri TaxID=433720 RepID=A0A814ATP4_9BILA|nr:unnamed protein product [Adineta steineri]